MLSKICPPYADEWIDEDVEETEARQEILLKHSYLSSHVLTEMDEFE